MAYKDPNRKLTVKDYAKLFVVLAFMGALIIFVLKLAGTPKPVATYSQVWDVLVAHGCEPEDLTEKYTDENPNAGIKKNIAAEKDGMRIDFFFFNDKNYADRTYGAIVTDLGDIERKYTNNNIQTGGYRANFVVYSLKAGGKYYYLMRIGETLLYATGNEEHSGEIYSIAKELGYYD